MSGHSARNMALLSSRQLARQLSTTSHAAGLSARLRKQWRVSPRPASSAAPSSSAAAPAPASVSASTSTSSSTAKHDKPQNNGASHQQHSFAQRKAAFRSLRHTSAGSSSNSASSSSSSPSSSSSSSSSTTSSSSSFKFVESADKGKARESSSHPRAASSAADHSASLLKELNSLDDLLDSLQSQAFSISQRLRNLELRRRDGSPDRLESTWGPDRLSPPGAGDSGQANVDAWSASPAEAPTSSRNTDKRSSEEPKTKLVHGNDLLASSNLRWRDGKGKMVESISYSGPFADEQKKWTESITGCVTAKGVPIDKVDPLRKMEVATLAHGLDRVLFNPGIYWLRDPRSGIYNFDPRIKDILDVDLFDYAALPPYITSSKDPELATLTQKHQKKYCGSTSSMTSLLSQCYFLISGWRQPDVSGFSSPFAGLPNGFSVGAKLPASILLHYKDGYYAIDADKTAAGEAENSNYVLTSLGKSMEKMLTATPEEYAKYMRINSWKLTEEEKTKPEAYHYASTDKIMMRSQLDCHDERLPRKTFDLKTRASIGIRNDRANYVEGSGYQIRRSTGVLESFEREYFDMIRAAFLKYNFQARIGHMDGIFVAYHTTSTIFGFQYISVEEMNERLFGTQEMADQAFRLSLGMMERVLDAATGVFPGESLKITVESKERKAEAVGLAGMSVYVEPANASSSSTERDGEGGEKTKRTIAQLDITVDRYLDGGLMLGPVDFTHLPGRRIDPLSDDEIERRMRSSLPPVRWEIDYSISPRPDLTEAKIRSNLDGVRAKQASLNSLILPNVDALNAREQYRTDELAKNPEALQRFLEERKSGVAAGMPLAPGQVSAETTVGSTKGKEGKKEKDVLPDDVLNPTAAGEDKSSRRKQAESRFVRMRNARTLRLRELARLGAKDAKDSSRLDRLVMYQPRS
ncbi:RNA processing-related protein, mitochondrial RNA degradation [Pseudozyma hubeiensis SY62]|uniref:RNA processing-related protein, mitochondrial RNA degradation n=1 Tax=Pseudozyma hubeiensis (strain SY62) TaxID=1305764 RepID=R9PL24_PSEHS|nr:RNA processing-related protein, mitochondrial RNA degradation [Pseudozyma hubeiensis SY62]GAC98790.1 RNA processing-related protein, mitochondrial RNA degradation [Pseudozyma hubeiensis SY62]